MGLERWRAHTLKAMLGEANTRLAATGGLQGIPSEVLAAIEKASRSEWMPASHANWITTRVAGSYATESERFKALCALGAACAHEATNTFLRLIIKMLTPSLLVRRLPDFMNHDIQGLKLNVELLDSRIEAAFIDPSVAYVGHIGVGFMSFVLETMGCTQVVGETPTPPLNEAIMDRYPFTVRWKA